MENPIKMDYLGVPLFLETSKLVYKAHELCLQMSESIVIGVTNQLRLSKGPDFVGILLPE